jgi:hypothetical protein
MERPVKAMGIGRTLYWEDDGRPQLSSPRTESFAGISPWIGGFWQGFTIWRRDFRPHCQLCLAGAALPVLARITRTEMAFLREPPIDLKS